MTSTRRIGAEKSATRARLLDGAQQLLLDEGYAAVTSRRVAAAAGLKPQLVHYYFRTMDDLWLALVRRGAEQNLERQALALDSPQPLRALWELNIDPVGTALAMELSSLANHRKAIRAELAAYAEQFRRLQTEAVAKALAARRAERPDLPPEVLSMLMIGIARVMVLEQTLGFTAGHAELRALVESYLDRFEGKPAGRTEPA
jgi:AcrR family transcriptional regulator